MKRLTALRASVLLILINSIGNCIYVSAKTQKPLREEDALPLIVDIKRLAKEIKKGLDVNIEIDTRSGHVTSFLILAIRNTEPAVVDLLLTNGANVNTRYEGDTALSFALYMDHEQQTTDSLEIVRSLITRGADISYRIPHSLASRLHWDRAPLHIAAIYGQLEIVKILIAKGANVNATDKDGFTPLYRAATNADSEAMRILIASGINVNAATDELGQTLLHKAALLNNAEAIKALVANGANVNVTDKKGVPPLYLAAANEKFEAMKALLASGININATDESGQTLLHKAVLLNDAKAIKALVANGANVNVTDKKGVPPLYLAAANEKFEAMKALLASGININATDESGQTLLHKAILLNDAKAIKALVANGANVDVTDEFKRYQKKVVAFMARLTLVPTIKFDGSPESKTIREDYAKMEEFDRTLKNIVESMLNLKNNPSLLSQDQLRTMQDEIFSFEKQSTALEQNTLYNRTMGVIMLSIAKHIVSLKAQREDILLLLQDFPRSTFEYNPKPSPGKQKKHGVVWLNKPSQGKELQLTSLEHLKEEFKKRSGTEAELRFQFP